MVGKTGGKSVKKRKQRVRVRKGEEQLEGKRVLVQKLTKIIEIGLSRLCLKPLPVGLLGNPLINKLGTQTACLRKATLIGLATTVINS